MNTNNLSANNAPRKKTGLTNTKAFVKTKSLTVGKFSGLKLTCDFFEQIVDKLLTSVLSLLAYEREYHEKTKRGS